jgi:hypothetical protein
MTTNQAGTKSSPRCARVFLQHPENHHDSPLLVAFVLTAHLSHAAIHYPNPLISRLESILVETDGAFNYRFKSAINPCTNYASGSQTHGRQKSAQWIRVIFLVFVTACVDEAIGGMDASIGFETERAGNVWHGR